MKNEPQDMQTISRRRFIQSTLGSTAGFVFALHLPFKHSMAATTASKELAPNAFVEIGRDNIVTVTVKHIEFGQGALTGLATLVAEELDADWSQVRAQLAPADVSLYAHTLGPVQFTGGSSAIANSFMQMRRAGATARAMLIEAAANQWGVEPKSLRADSGVVKEIRGQREISFGELVEAASKLAPPPEVALKDPKDFKLIGHDLPKIDTVDKTTGKTTFTIDVARPGQWTVLVAHPSRFGARIASFDSTKAKAISGVMAVEKIAEGVAVYAKNFWSAKKARDLLDVQWDESGVERRDSKTVITEYQSLAKKPGLPAGRRGDAAMEDVFAKSSTVIESEFVFPYLAHAPMEPLDGVIEKKGKGYEIWMGAQAASRDRAALAEELGVPLDEIQLNVMFAGGSFGRRSQHKSQFARELAHASKAIDSRVPIKLLWTREDDIRGGFYRPIYVHRLKGGLDAEGKIVAWQQVIVGQSVQKGGPLESLFIRDGVDVTSVEGAANLSYAIPNLDVSLHSPEVGIPVLWWRSVGHTHTGFSAEAFVDELLVAGGQDPIKGRLELLGNHPRHRGVLTAAAEMADWGVSLAPGRARGVAVHESFGSFVAQIVEISRNSDGAPKVEKVWCAVDCGIAVNPNIIRAQMEGGIGYGLGAALRNTIDINDGRVVQSNFHDYHPLRIDDMPEIEVRIIASSEAPTGVGEPGTPPIAPAVANAWAALTGTRLRKMPFNSNLS
jgi:isoquinoline 1-oxidoreductase beta subunit